MNKALFLSIIFYAIFSQEAACQDFSFQFSQLNIYSGLPNNEVRSILKDKKGFLWFGTAAGLSRYDGVKFKVFHHDDTDSTSLYDDQILGVDEAPNSEIWIRTKFGLNVYNVETETLSRDFTAAAKTLNLPNLSFTSIEKDLYGNFWFVYPGKGLYCYNQKTNTTTHIFNTNISHPLHSNFVSSVDTDSRGIMWIIYQDGSIAKFSLALNKITYHSNSLRAIFAGTKSLLVKVDNDNDPWFYSNATFKSIGAVYLDVKKSKFRLLSQTSSPAKLNTNTVRGLVQDDNGFIWIATDHGGINLFSKKDLSIKYITNQQGDDKSISQNSIIGIYKDDKGIIWLGTYKKGVSYYHAYINRFPLFKHIPYDNRALPYNDVNIFEEDDKGNIWIGTNGGGLIYLNRTTGKYTRYLHQKDNPNSLASNVIVSLLLAEDKKLYIGTYLGGLDCFDGKVFKHFKSNPNYASTIGDDNIWELKEDNFKRIWIGTLHNGVSSFDPKTSTFKRYPGAVPNSVRSLYIPAICCDKQNNIWFAGYTGLDMLDLKTGKFTYFKADKKSPYSLINNNVNSIIQDSRGWIWVGTRGGISILKGKTKGFLNIQKNSGLPANEILDIVEDANKNIWISTLNGICMIKVSNKNNKYFFEYQKFDERDGLQGRVFNENAASRLSTGELIFGGSNGFNLFKPSNQQYYTEKPLLLLTGLQIFNQTVGVNQEVDGKVVLKKTISDLKTIELNYDQNFFSIEFAALNYLHPEKIRYQYMMEGLDEDWVNAIETHQATYMHLNYGNYTFKVKALNGNSYSIQSLQIKILPPFYRTYTAYFVYLLILFGVLYYLRYRGIQKIKAKFALKQERKEADDRLENQSKEARRLNELYMLKIKFFTNVSHEFRTPLSLIIAPLDKLVQTVNSPNEKSQISLLKKNADRLLNLVNQLLDFRKMEAKELELDVTKGDIILFIKDVCDSFRDIADAKRIRFVFNSEIESFITLFDRNKIERILLNLLSNAFKFTLTDGKICVFVDEINKLDHAKERVLQIKVIDSGIGIPEDKLDKVFDNFFQTKMPEFILNQGSGIGLSIAKEFVELHKGIVTVDSKVKEGTCFTIEIPLPILKVQKFPDLNIPDDSLPKISTVTKTGVNAKAKPLILLVEDNDDFRFYLKDALNSYFSIIEASNGKEGWQKSLSLHPDLVVTDISMPEMDGIELLKKIKADKRTNHIPVILLTALTGDQELLKGLQTGANEYITKPFNFEILVPKIKNLLMLRQTFKKTYSKQVDVNLADIEVQSENEKFMTAMVAYIEKNIHNPQLSVEDLSRNMAMSRVSLYKRVLSITGKAPVDFIRSYRLKKAAQLLEKSQKNIAEIAYEVGFNTPNYFAKAFKNEFNMLPSEFINTYRSTDKMSHL